jgi:hypothetical protein
MEQHGAAGRDAYIAGRDQYKADRDIHIYNDAQRAPGGEERNPSLSWDDFIGTLLSSSPPKQAEVFWAKENEGHRRRALGSDELKVADAAMVITAHANANLANIGEISRLIEEVNVGRAVVILRVLDKSLQSRILVGMGGDLVQFLIHANAEDEAAAASFLYRCASAPAFHGAFRPILASAALNEWRQAWMEKLPPAGCAHLLRVVEEKWPGEVLGSMPHSAAVGVIRSEYGTGRWLPQVAVDQRRRIATEMATTCPDILLKRLLDLPWKHASELASIVCGDREAFKALTSKLSDWDLVIFMAAASVKKEQLSPLLLSTLRGIVKVWPVFAAFNAIGAASRHRRTVPHYIGFSDAPPPRLRIFLSVYAAAAMWTEELGNQRKREFKIFLSGAATALIILIVIGIIRTS